MNIEISRIPDNPKSAAAGSKSSSFYFAMRILGREQRQAMFEIYSFCRAVDDIADCNAPREWRLRWLTDWRRYIDHIFEGTVPNGLEELALAIARFHLRKNDLLAVIDGMEMDASTDICAPSLERFELYCDRVACAVGRLSVNVFGMDEGDGRRLAHHLGRALQITNILRDLDEDAAFGRLYLPKEALQNAEIDLTDPVTVLTDPKLNKACGFLAKRARQHFAIADEIMAGSPRRVVRAPKIMCDVYRQILVDLTTRGWAVPRQRVHVNKSRLLWIALRHAII